MLQLQLTACQLAKKTPAAIQVRAPQFFFRMHPRNVRTSDEDPGNAPHARAAGSRRRPSPARLRIVLAHTANPGMNQFNYSIKVQR
jgi:hypothetical protein